MPHSKNEVVESVVSKLLVTEGAIAVMAGHFCLVQRRENGEVMAGIAEDITHKKVREFVESHPYTRGFPVETWRAGIEVVLRLRAVGREAKLLVLVNDWQFVERMQDGERHAARDAFYHEAKLPPTFQKMLVEAGLSETDIITDVRDNRQCIMWSESSLRARYGRGPLKLKVPIDNGCAQEWIPLLARLEELQFGGFASFIPNSCHAPVTFGSILATDLLELKMELVMVFPGQCDEGFWYSTYIC